VLVSEDVMGKKNIISELLVSILLKYNQRSAVPGMFIYPVGHFFQDRERADGENEIYCWVVD
jgi:hypothetical protein